MNLEVPRELPANLSHTAVNLYLRCPEKWRRRYIDNEYEPPSGKMVVGRAVHQAESASFHCQVAEGEPYTVERVLDEYDLCFDNEAGGEEIVWGETSQGKEKDLGAALVGQYHRSVVPLMKPSFVERRFQFSLPHADWSLSGFIDVEGEFAGTLGIDDLKVVSRAYNQEDLDTDGQATLYVAARQAQGAEIMPVRFHALKKAVREPDVTVYHTSRTQHQVNSYLSRVAGVAREIDWRIQSGNWQGAAGGSWWCREKTCGYFNDCVFSGAIK